MQKNAQATEQGQDLAHPMDKAVARQEDLLSQEDQVSLARRLRRGRQAAAEELVDKYYRRIYLFMRAMGHDCQISEDLTQETFLRVWYHIGQLRDGKALNGWLFRIAGNVSRLHWRKGKNKEQISLDRVAGPAYDVSSSETVGEQERFARLQEAVGRLRWKLRQAVVLHYMGQLTIAEAAEAAGVRVGTLKSRLNRALEALRNDMADE